MGLESHISKRSVHYYKIRKNETPRKFGFRGAFLFVGRVALEGVVGVENHDALDGLLGGSERDGRCCGRSRCRSCRCSTRCCCSRNNRLVLGSLFVWLRLDGRSVRDRHRLVGYLAGGHSRTIHRTLAPQQPIGIELWVGRKNFADHLPGGFVASAQDMRDCTVTVTDGSSELAGLDFLACEELFEFLGHLDKVFTNIKLFLFATK